jgi:hypothetical protein
MASFYNSNLKPLVPGTYTHPYEHATKLFLVDNFRLAPKQTFSYYVVININSNLGNDIISQVVNLFTQQIFASGLSSQTTIENYEIGLLAKKVELPKFKISTKTLNAYNRKNIIQTNINYDPITITFHDDMADVVTKFWNDYYTYYYRDSDYTKSYYNVPHKYQPRLTDGWGYTPRNASTVPFLTSIQLFSLHNKRFTEYEIINPYITDWRHGEHSSDQGNGIMENTMTVIFETVKYRTGYINPLDVSGFATIHYDNFRSPISTSDSNIYDDNGIIGVLTNGTKDLARPDGQGSGANIFNAILNAKNLAKNLKNINFTNLAKSTLTSIGITAINSAVNAAIGNPFTVPTASLGSGLIYRNSNILSNPVSSPGFYNGVTINGSSIAGSIGAGIISVGATVANNFVNGVVTDIVQQGTTQLFQVAQNTGGTILVDSYGRPVTNQSTAFTVDQNGNQIGTYQVLTTREGTYNSSAPFDNLQSTTVLRQPDGQFYTQYKYLDGTIRTVDSNGFDIDIQPGRSFTGQPGPPAVPINTSTAILQGQPYNNGAVRFYTDPNTGVTYSIGGTSAQITNTITGTTGLVAGAYVGAGVNKALTNVLGKGVLGQAVSASVSGAAALVTGRLVNNALQPIVNSFTGAIGQGIESVTGSIRNFGGEIFKTGGFSASSPTKNIDNQQIFDDGSAIITYKDGSVWTKDTEGNFTQTSPATAGSWYSSILGPNSDRTAANPGFSFGSSTNTEYAASIWTDGAGNPILSGSGGYVFSGGRILEENVFDPTYSGSFIPTSVVQESIANFGGGYELGGLTSVGEDAFDWTSQWGQDY